MKSIFLSDDKISLENVYSGYIKEETPLYSKEDILANPSFFKDTEVIFSTWGMPTFDKEEIQDCFPTLKAIFYSAGSVQSFAREFLELGVRVFSAYSANALPVAEFAMSEIILANKGFFKAIKKKSTREDVSGYKGNFKAKVGIVGVGTIGTLLIKKLKTFDFEILVFDPFLSDSKAEKLEVKKVSLEELFSRCEVISNHLADNEETKNIFKKRLFELMPPYSTFINTGRGRQVVESDLAEVLKNRPDLTALLDVTYPEPPLDDSPFYSLDNCIITPHIAGSMAEEVRRMAEYMTEEFKRFSNGEECKYEVTLDMLKTMA